MTSINSVGLYTDLESAYLEVQQWLSPYVENGTIYLSFWCGYHNRPYWVVEVVGRTSEKVRGVHLEEIIQELQRRLNFGTTQASLKLGKPVIDTVETIESAPVSSLPATSDDEIPF